MGQAIGKSAGGDESAVPQRGGGITGGATAKAQLPKLPAGSVKANPDEYSTIEVRRGSQQRYHAAATLLFT